MLFHDRSLIIDYTAEIQDVYCSFVRAVILGSGELDILGVCSSQHRCPGLTRSWTLDWSRSPLYAPLSPAMIMQTGRRCHERLFDATPDTKATVLFGEGPDILKIIGLLWDVVTTVSKIDYQDVFKFITKSSKRR